MSDQQVTTTEAPDGLAPAVRLSTLDRLLRDPALEQALRSNARARAEHYHLDAIAERYARMLSEYLA